MLRRDERVAFNQLVLGSNPGRPTIFLPLPVRAYLDNFN